jgi:hypothetical protein|tara:strand:- start:30 stop:386 length:357 start_codon:yes stop_codon:yes gene_type:complete
MKRKPNKYQKLINKFINDPAAIWKNRGFIAREIAIGKKLYVLMEDEKFWKESYLPFKLNSLAWLLSADGIEWINSEAVRMKLNLPEPIVYELEEEKLGKDVNINKPKKTIMDFLKDAS